MVDKVYVPGQGGGSTTSATSSSSDGAIITGNGFSASFQVPTTLGASPAAIRPTKGDSDYAGINFGPRFEDNTALLSKLYALPPNQLADLQTQLRLAGYGKNIKSTGYPDPETLVAYNDLLKDTRNYAQANPDNPPYTPDSLLATKAAAYNSLGEAAGGAAATTDPLVAQALATRALQGHLGRKPNEAEQAQFAQTLSSYYAQPNASSTGASQLADNFATADQGRANEAGALNETRFVDVLHKLMSGG